MLKTIVLAATIATSPSSGDEPQMPSVMSDLGIDATIAERFEALDGALTGWVLEHDGQRSLIYTTPDENYLVMGSVVDGEGNNITEAHSDTYDVASHNRAQQGGNRQAQQGANPRAQQGQARQNNQARPQQRSRPSAPDAESALTAIESAHWIEEGSGDVIVYAFHEPRCPGCSRLWRQSRNHLDQITFRWIPVGFLGMPNDDTSVRIAAGVLGSDNPIETLTRWESEQVMPENQGERSKVESNNRAMRQAGFSGTPAIVVVDGDRAETVQGLPPGFLDGVASGDF